MVGGLGDAFLDVFFDEPAEAGRMGFGKAEVFVHVEDGDAVPGDIPACGQVGEEEDLGGRGSEDDAGLFLFGEEVFEVFGGGVGGGLRHFFLGWVDVDAEFVSDKHMFWFGLNGFRLHCPSFPCWWFFFFKSGLDFVIRQTLTFESVFEGFSERFPMGGMGEDGFVVVPALEFRGGVFVQDHDAVWMELEGGGGDHGGDGAFYGFGDDIGFFQTGGQEEAASGFEDGFYSHGQGHMGNLGGVWKEGSILFDRFRGEDLDVGPGHQAGKGFVKADVTDSADSQELEIDSSGSTDQFFVPLAFGF